MTWKPFPGGCFDLSTLTGPPTPSEKTFLKKNWDHAKYIRPIESLANRALTRLEDLQSYFDWAKFDNYDLLLNVTETDDKFSQIVRVFWVDFFGNRATVSAERPRDGEHIYAMRVRSSSFRFILNEGRSWDDLYIGFKGRFCVTPDVYHFKFLNHFSNLLPNFKPNLPLLGASEERSWLPLVALMIDIFAVSFELFRRLFCELT